MVWGGQPLSCTPSGGVTAKVVGTSEYRNYIEIELTNYSQSRMTVHGEVTCNGKLDGRFVETALPSSDGKKATVTTLNTIPQRKFKVQGAFILLWVNLTPVFVHSPRKCVRKIHFSKNGTPPDGGVPFLDVDGGSLCGVEARQNLKKGCTQ